MNADNEARMGSTYLERLKEYGSRLALIVVDQQRDFEPGGALAVAGGNEVAPEIAQMMKADFSCVVVTQDSHPKCHISFASSYDGKKPFDVLTKSEVSAGRVSSKFFSREVILDYLSRVPQQTQVLWPDHCIRGSDGWQMNPLLPLECADLILRKGTRLEVDSYSAFFENDGTSTGLSAYLKARGISAVLVVGLAGDYCVAWSALDARREGFEVFYSERLTRFVNFPENSRQSALQNLKAAHVQFIS